MPKAAEVAFERAVEAECRVVPISRRWSGPHAVNIRLTIHLLTQSYYLTILAGPERRSSQRLHREREKHPLATKANVAALFAMGVVLGGACWIGLETLVPKVLQLIAN